MAEPTVSQVVVPPTQVQKRLDLFLTHQFPQHSRSYFARLIRSGQVLVNGVKAKPAQKTRAGDAVTLQLFPQFEPTLEPEPIPLDIVYEDDDLLVINKPAGLVVHPAVGHWTGTLVHALLHHGQSLSQPAPWRPGIVHRLDKDTSGLLVVAKNDFVHARLAEQLKQRTLSRHYLAIVCGHLPKITGMIDLPLGRSRKERKKIVVTRIKSRPAQTLYEVRRQFSLCDLVGVSLLTGRTHQIRAHLSHLGHPVLGDPEYGGRAKWWSGLSGQKRKRAQELLTFIDRQALHAEKIAFVHPRTEKKLEFSASPPQDFQRVVQSLEKEVESQTCKPS